MLVVSVIFALALATLGGTHQAATVTEQDWTAFMQWLASQPPNGDPPKLLGGYRDELIRRGAKADEAARLTAAVTGLVYRRPEGVRLLWDKVYAGKNSVFADRPTELLVRAVEGRPVGSALDFGMGQGRNTIFLALNKWSVSGFDPSAEGIRQAKARAQALGLTIDTAVSTDEQFDFGSERWDLIVVTYVRHLSREDADRFWRALRPGGLVVYENAAAANNDVLLAFGAYRIIRWEDVLDAPDWGTGGQIRLQRLVAEKRKQ